MMQLQILIRNTINVSVSDLFSDALDYEDSYGYDIDYLEEVDENGIGYMDLAKTSYFSIGVDYTLSDFPINIFGFLDPLKKY